MTRSRTTIAVALALVGLCALRAAAQAAPDDSPTGVVNLNGANEEELMRLPGIGPTKAGRILLWRKKHGDFKKVEELTRVKGFGRKTLKRLKPFLSVTGPTTYAGGKEKTPDEPTQ